MVVLQNEGFSCKCVTNGKAAIKEFLNKKYDVVFMDCQMPIMDGYRAAIIIRELSEEYIPIIALTANAMKGDKERCEQAGMDDYLSKPIDINRLRIMLSKYVSNYEEAKAMIKEKAVIRFDDVVFKIISELNFTKEVAEELVMDFAGTIKESLYKLRNAAYTKDYLEIERISHSIKGASSNLRMKELVEVSFELEKNARLNNLELCNNDIKKINDIYLNLQIDIYNG